MNCQEAINLLYDVIDREASEVDMATVKEHLGRCKDCAGVYEVEEAISRMIIERARNSEPSEHFDALKVKVLVQLDRIDSEAC